MVVICPTPRNRVQNVKGNFLVMFWILFFIMNICSLGGLVILLISLFGIEQIDSPGIQEGIDYSFKQS